jgi:hypothetical protein
MRDSPSIPPVIKEMIERAKQPRPPETDEVARKFVLGHAPLKDYLEALHKSRS